MSWYNRIMLKRLLLGLFSLLIFFSIYSATSTPTQAAETDSVDDMIDDFCKRRQGNQMNLEIWYSGKCKDPSSIGFSQIVLLDLLSRTQGDTFEDKNPLQILQMLITFDKKSGRAVAQIPTEPLVGNGVIGQLGKAIGFAYQSPPVSLGSYLADVRQNIEKHSLVKPAYAQGAGYGFQNLLPVLPIWKAFRNVAYFVFILVFVLYGFMIMFRMKINPQNTASFQAAIPKIVMTLLIITFAYAIAGFLIDIMYVIFNLILSIFASSGMINVDNWWNSKVILLASGQGGLLPSFIFSIATAIFFVPSSLINVLTQLPGAASLVIDLVLTATGLGLILRLIIVIAIGYSYMKLIFKLFEAYITVIIQVIFSPLILLQDVLPGSDAFGGWMRNIAANLSVFPVTMIMFLLSYIFMIQPFTSQFGIGGASGLSGITGVPPLPAANGLAVPLIGGPIAPIIGSWTNSESILAVIGFFIILMASKYVDMVKDALKVPPFKYGTALSDALNYGLGQFTNQRSLYNRYLGTDSAGTQHAVSAGINRVIGTTNAVAGTNIPTVAGQRAAIKDVQLGLK
mgnify:FL=1